MRPRRFGILLLAAAVAPHCGEAGHPTAPSPAAAAAAGTPEAAQVYLDGVLEIMRQYSVNTAALDWEMVRAQVRAAAIERVVPNAYAGVAVTLKLLGDQESVYLSRDGQTIGPPPAGGCVALASGSPDVPDTVGYVRVPGCACETSTDTMRFAESIQEAISFGFDSSRRDPRRAAGGPRPRRCVAAGQRLMTTPARRAPVARMRVYPDRHRQQPANARRAP